MANDPIIRIPVEVGELKTALKDIGMSIDRLNKSIDNMGQKMTTTGRKTARQQKVVNKELENTKAQLDAVKQKILDYSKRYTSLSNKELRQLKKLKKERESLRGAIKKQEQAAVSGANNAAAAQGRLNNQVSLGRQLFLRLRSVMLTVFGAYAIINGIKNTVSAIANFELGMARVAAITGATDEALQKLTNSALKASTSGIFSPAEMADVQVILAKLGFTVDEIGSSIEGISNLSLATGEDLATSAELVASTLRGLGLEASQTRHVVDVMGKSFTTSALDVRKYAESIKYLAPIARNMGWELQDITSILGILADNMISGSLAGTGVRQMLIQLADASSDANKVLGRQVTTFEDFLQFLEKLKDSGAGLNEAVQLFNKRSATAVVSLIENSAKLREYRGEMDKTSGAIKEMADRVRNELIPATQNLNASWQAWLNSTTGTGGLGDVLTNIKGAIDAITLANINNIRTWNTAAEAIENYKEQWLNFFTGRGFDLRAVFMNDAFDDLQISLKTLDENITLITSDYGDFFDKVIAGTRNITNEQDRAIARSQQYSTKLGDTYRILSERETELRDNIERRRELLQQLREGGFSTSKKTEIMDEIDQLKIRSVELETLISVYKNLGKELRDNISANLINIDVEVLKEKFYTLSNTYESLGVAIKNSPIGQYLRTQMNLYQEAIRKAMSGSDDLVEDLTEEQIAAMRNLLRMREQYELDMASLIEDDLERELKIAEIKHKYAKEGYDLDIMLAENNAEMIQAIHNQMAADEKVFQQTIADIRQKFRDKDFKEALKNADDYIALQKAKNDREIASMKLNNAKKEEIWRRQLELDIQLLELEILIAQEAGEATLKIQTMNEELGKMQDELDAGFSDDSIKKIEKNVDKTLNAYERLANEIVDYLKDIANAHVENTSRIVDDLDTRIAETQRSLDQEIQLYTEGYANNVTAKRAEVAELKAARDQALRDREKAVRRQQALDSITQAVNLATAVSNIIKDYSKIPYVGLALAAGVIAGMIALFSSMKSKSNSLAQYGEGGDIKGRSHADGGVVIEAEGGEFVINKRAYSKYPDLVRAINEDDVPTINQSLLSNTSIESKSKNVFKTKELGEIRDLLKKNLTHSTVEVVGDTKIITRGIKKRMIKLR